MQKWFKILILPFLVLFLLAGTALADNITIYDGRGYLGTGTGNEFDETEPDMILSSDWDLQAFLLNGNTLSMGGGFNFINGAPGVYYKDDRYASGDIFPGHNWRCSIRRKCNRSYEMDTILSSM